MLVEHDGKQGECNSRLLKVIPRSHSGLLAPNFDETRNKSREDITSGALSCFIRNVLLVTYIR